MLALGSQGRLQGAGELIAQTTEPCSMRFGPRGATLGEDVTVVAQHAADAMLGGGGVALIGVAQADQSAKRLLFARWHVDGREMTAAVETCEVDGIDAVSLAVVPGLLWDQRGSDDFAVKAVLGEYAMKYEAGSGGLVAGSHRALGGELSKEASHLHEISGERDDLGVVALPFEDGGGNRFGMNIETDPGIL